MLCKSLLLENKKVTTEAADETNPKFLLVVIQYETTLDVKKLTTSVRKLRPVTDRLGESSYDFQVASAEDNDRITGYKFNSVTPFGLKEKVMIVLSSEILPYSYFWMGGGHIHLKLGMSVSEFQKLGNVKVMDRSQSGIVGERLFPNTDTPSMVTVANEMQIRMGSLPASILLRLSSEA